MKFVIARTEGPKYNGSKVGCLTPGKLYEVLNISYHKDNKWIYEDLTFNPRKTAFYIKIKEDDNGKEHYLWNDHFLSSEEIREIKRDSLINKIK